jgi:hypothetical protein
LIQFGWSRCISREIAYRDLVRKASKNRQRESRSRKVRYSDSDVSVWDRRCKWKTGGGDWRSCEFRARKLKAQLLEGSSHEARGSEGATGEYRSLVTSGVGRRRKGRMKSRVEKL